MLAKLLCTVLVCICLHTSVVAQPGYCLTIDYGRLMPFYSNGMLSKTYLFNMGFDMYKQPTAKPLSVVMGMRIGALKNDDVYNDEYRRTYLWGTKLQAGFVAGMQLQQAIGKRWLQGGIVAGPVHLVNIEAGDFDKPLSAIITESYAMIGVSRYISIGAKYIYYPAMFDNKLHFVNNSQQSIVAAAFRIRF